MRNLEARHDEPNPLAREGRLLGSANDVAHSVQVLGELWGAIDPVIDLLPGHHQGVARCDRVDGHERNAVIVAPDKRAGDLAVDDPGEDGGHRLHRREVGPGRARSLGYHRVVATAVEQPTGSSGLLTVPNLITLARLACIPVFLVLLFGADSRLAAGVLLGVLGATDWVDGYAARRLGQVSEIGKVLDPAADRLLFIVGVGGIIIDRSAPLWFSILVVAREAVFGALMVVLTAMGMKRFDVTYLGKCATFALMFAFPIFLLHAGVDTARTAWWIAAWVFAIPGLALSYYTAVAYIPMIRRALREGRAERELERQQKGSQR